MPVLSNPQWEQFATLCAGGMATKKAYAEAGYAGGGRAYELAANPKVKERIAELDSRNKATGGGQTVERMVAELDEMYDASKRLGTPAAGVAAVMAKAKLLGLIIDKSEVETNVRKPLRDSADAPKGPMSLEEWKAKFKPKSEAS